MTNSNLKEELKYEIENLLDADADLNSADDDYTEDRYGSISIRMSFMEAMEKYEDARNDLIDGIKALTGCDDREAKKVAYDLTGLAYIH